jgi:hypothetical protein
MLVSKIVPHVMTLGLLDDWLRARFARLGILPSEHLEASDVAALAAEPARGLVQ